MTLDAAKNSDTHIALYVPQAQRVIFAAGEQQLRQHRMELELIDGMTMSDVVLGALMLNYVEDAYDTAVASCRQHWVPSYRVI